MHNGYLNTYSFTKEGKKITLAPLALPNSTKMPHKNTLNIQIYFSLLMNPLLKATLHEFQAFKEWILIIQDGLKFTPRTPTCHDPTSNIHSYLSTRDSSWFTP